MIYPIARVLFFPVIRFFIRKTVGLEHIPKQGPYIIACKHMGSLDGVFIGAVLVPYLNKKIYFVSNIARWGFLWEKLVAEKWAGCIPFYKENPRICLEIAHDYLKQGRIVGIFPEGHLSPGDSPRNRAKTGTARLALWSQVPIVPIGLKHDITIRHDVPRLTRRRQAILNTLLNPHSMEIHIGQPFELREFYGQAINREVLDAATSKIMAHIEHLTDLKFSPTSDTINS